MRIFTIILCLFLSVHAMGQMADTAAKHSTETVRFRDTTFHPEKMLIIVDGIIYKDNLKTIDSANISGIDILKADDAVKIYGPQAVNGAILITTKKANLPPDTSIVIRDVPSVPVSTKPLLVVDGIIFKGSLKTINPNDIAEVTVLKGKSAVALYGTSATNGVFLISMKESWRIKHKRQPPPKPLFVVDGVIFKGDIRTIDPKTIASTSILRKEYAVPLYGPAGANGAIIITTKNAVKGFKADTIR
jgi:TonB-dependent SusC/RagA subfamily outer membrane receptor